MVDTKASKDKVTKGRLAAKRIQIISVAGGTAIGTGKRGDLMKTRCYDGNNKPMKCPDIIIIEPDPPKKKKGK